MKRVCLLIAVVFTFMAGFAGVPAESFAKSTQSENTANQVLSGPVDINTADEAILSSLPGIGPKTAEAITDYRKQHGNFKSVDDLQQVKGIGTVKLAKLKPFLKKI